MIRRCRAILTVIGEYSVYSAIQFGLSYAIGAYLHSDELALVSYAMMTATFFTSLLRAGLLAPLIHSEVPSSSTLTPSHWRVVICWATALGAALCLISSISASTANNTLHAKALALSVLAVLTMPTYDFARRRTLAASATTTIGVTVFLVTVAAASAILALIPAARTALVATLLVAGCYFVASMSLFRDAASTLMSLANWRQVWSEAGSTISLSPVTAIATGAIMQGIPLWAGATVGPSLLALFYVSRVLAMPAANVLQAADALQKADCRRRCHSGTLTTGAIMTGAALVAFVALYALALTMVLPGLQTIVAPSYHSLPMAAVGGWAALLAAQAASGTLDNVALAQGRPSLVAVSRTLGAVVALGFWRFSHPADLVGILLIMALGFVVSGVFTALLLVTLHYKTK